MNKYLSILIVLFLIGSFAGLLGWVAARIHGPFGSLSHDGFRELTGVCLTFVMALSLVQIAVNKQK